MTDAMRISFSGASGTGKTTLATWVSETYGIPMNPVGSRSVAKSMGFDSPYDVDKAGKRADFQRLLLSKKVAWESGRESFVTDRTTFDNIAYTALHDVHSIDESLMAEAVDGIYRYTLVVMCPMSGFFDPGDDPARVKSRTYHELFEALAFGLVKQHVSDLGRHVLECRKLSARQLELGRFL